MRTAIVILNYNTRTYLERFLPDVEATTRGLAELWVVDNASEDDSAEWVRDHMPAVKLIQLDRNYGFAGGYNRALERIDADQYLLLNSDVRVEGNWLSPLLDRLASDPSIAGVQPKVLSERDADRFEYAGASGGFLDRWGYPFCRGRIFDEVEMDSGQYNEARRIFWATGAALLIRSELFHSCGGFDERFFAHMEEIDLCWRLQHRGYSLWVEPRSQVHHVGGGTLKLGSEFKYYLNYRNNLAMLTKNLSGGLWWTVLIWKMVLDGLSALNFLLGGRPKVFVTIVRAHMHFWRHLPYWIGRRKANLRAVPNRKLLYSGSVVWSYFALGRKRFDQLKGSIRP